MFPRVATNLSVHWVRRQCCVGRQRDMNIGPAQARFPRSTDNSSIAGEQYQSDLPVWRHNFRDDQLTSEQCPSASGRKASSPGTVLISLNMSHSPFDSETGLVCIK
jgi:hypothetical protein